MKSNQKIYTGLLTVENGGAYLLAEDGTHHLAGSAIWCGYTRHWTGLKLNGAQLPETDYHTGKHIALLWPYHEPEHGPFIELYYNERLVRYGISFMGHSAINVNGSIFNFSHMVNECEVMNGAEYFFRPALGRFAPAPGGGFSMDDPAHPYLDKFGRQFMRNIHVLRVTGFETDRLSAELNSELATIHATPEDPSHPGMYRDFNILTRSCTTVIRDALRRSGFHDISGVFPRELFTSAAWSFIKMAKRGALKVSVSTRRQIAVDEAPPCKMTPLINPLNVYRRLRLRMRGVSV